MPPLGTSLLPSPLSFLLLSLAPVALAAPPREPAPPPAGVGYAQVRDY